LLKELQDIGYVKSQRHDTLPLTLYSYTKSVQWDKAWVTYPILKKTRGIVLDDSGEIVSYPFEKFQNWEQLLPSDIPSEGEKIEITEKMDGSLFIVSRYDNEIVCNTRGSFRSDAGILAENLFYKLYDPKWIEDGKTYLFEFCSIANRVVVTYSEPRLILLAIFETATGKDLPRDSRFDCVPTFEFNGGLFSQELYDYFKSLELPNKEGFVIRKIGNEDRQDFRMKYKIEPYLRAHGYVTNLSTKGVWEMLSTNQSFQEIIEVVPDEFYEWLSKTIDGLNSDYKALEAEALAEYNEVMKWPTIKEQAIVAREKYPDNFSIIMNMIKGKDYSETIWDRIRPEYVKPFSVKMEEA
jgi:RNA ligase